MATRGVCMSLSCACCFPMQLKRAPLKNNYYPMETRGVCMSLSCACCFPMQLKRAPLKKQRPPDGIHKKCKKMQKMQPHQNAKNAKNAKKCKLHSPPPMQAQCIATTLSHWYWSHWQAQPRMWTFQGIKFAARYQRHTKGGSAVGLVWRRYKPWISVPGIFGPKLMAFVFEAIRAFFNEKKNWRAPIYGFPGKLPRIPWSRLRDPKIAIPIPKIAESIPKIAIFRNWFCKFFLQKIAISA